MDVMSEAEKMQRVLGEIESLISADEPSLDLIRLRHHFRSALDAVLGVCQIAERAI